MVLHTPEHVHPVVSMVASAGAAHPNDSAETSASITRRSAPFARLTGASVLPTARVALPTPTGGGDFSQRGGEKYSLEEFRSVLSLFVSAAREHIPTWINL